MSQIKTGSGELPVLNFANQIDSCTLFQGTQLSRCPEIEDDIQTCQQQHQKKILLSIGGATYTEGGFTSSADAVAAADLVWSMFGPRHTTNSTTMQHRRGLALRPFGDAVLDGFDLDFESPVQNAVPFANRLRHLMSLDKSKEYLLTVAPQCVYPDVANGDMLNGNVSFDAVFVQFYNNPCGVHSFRGGAANHTQFDFSVWDAWARTKSANSDVKVFVGVPASPQAASLGYMSAAALTPVVDYCKGFRSFGGVMMWDASQAYANEGFIEGVKGAVQSISSPVKRGAPAVRDLGEVVRH